MKILVVLMLLQLASLSTLASTRTPGETFSFSVRGDGNFSLNMEAVLSPERTLADAHAVLSDPNNLSAVSEIIGNAKIQPTGNTSYSLSTTWQRFHISRQLISDCNETSTSTGFEQSCTLRLNRNPGDASDKGQTGILFAAGGTDTHCEKSSGPVVCQIRVFGQAKGLNVIVLKKTGADMALNGAGFNLHDTSLVLEMLSDHKTASEVKASFPGSNLGVLVQALYDQLKDHVDAIPKGQALYASGDTRLGISSFQTGLIPSEE